MLFYSDERTRSLEREGKMIDCVEYLFDKWNGDRNNVPLMLKLAITIWYTFDMDGKELSLTREEQYYLGNMMNNVYCYFMRHRARDENCQWIFGYIMRIRNGEFSLLHFEFYFDRKNRGLPERAISRSRKCICTIL